MRLANILCQQDEYRQAFSMLNVVRDLYKREPMVPKRQKNLDLIHLTRAYFEFRRGCYHDCSEELFDVKTNTMYYRSLAFCSEYERKHHQIDPNSEEMQEFFREHRDRLKVECTADTHASFSFMVLGVL